MQTNTISSTPSSQDPGQTANSIKHPVSYWVPDMPTLIAQRASSKQDFLSKALLLERALILSHRQAEIRTLRELGPLALYGEWADYTHWYDYYQSAIKTEMDLVFQLHRSGQLDEYFSTTQIA